MTDRSTVPITLRKQPKQSRSSDLVATILEAAVQVLRAQGARGFTTARVASRAGVSIGSLYQYFPNKAAILFRLQSEEWRHTTDQWKTILGDTTRHPLERLRDLAHAFLRSECDEAAVRMALDKAAPSYRDVREAREARAEADQAVELFVRQALPDATDELCERAADLIGTTLGAVGKGFSQVPRTQAEVDAYADAVADMLCAYLAALGPRSVA